MKPRIILSFAVLKRGLESEMSYIKWCEQTIQLLQATSFIWQKEEEKYQVHSEDGELIEYTTNTPFEDLEAILEDYLYNGLMEV